jgi:serine/threonine-protein kinase
MLRLSMLLVICPAIAAAQNVTDSKAAADTLFDEGKKMLAEGDIDHACPKFEASLKLADQLGVRLNLADCYEKQGKTASAWAEFREAASRAEKKADKRAEFAHQRADALAPKLVKLQISVPAASRVPGLAVRRDGTPVPAEAFDVAFPVNPGGYIIDASATGYQTWQGRVDASKPGETVTIEVPRLGAAPHEAEPAKLPPTSEHASKPDEEEPKVIDHSAARHSRHVLGIGVAGGGVALLGVGVGLGLAAKSKWDSVGMHCNAMHVCDATGVSINSSARALGNAGSVIGGVGIAAVAAGAVLYLTAPAARQVIEHARVDVSPSGGVVGITASF